MVNCNNDLILLTLFIIDIGFAKSVSNKEIIHCMNTNIYITL